MDFEINGVAYKAKPMDLFTQMDIVSLLSPLIAMGGADIIPMIQEVSKEAKENNIPFKDLLMELPFDEMVKRFGGLTRELAKMPSEDRRFILTSCMKLVQWKVKEGQWADVWVSGAGGSTPELNSLWLTIQIAFHVIKGQLFPFFTASL
jgi:hypothetical protein